MRLLAAIALVLLVPACDDPGAGLDLAAGGLDGLAMVPGWGALAGVALVLRKLRGPSRAEPMVAAVESRVDEDRERIARLEREVGDMRAALLSAGMTALVERRAAS